MAWQGTQGGPQVPKRHIDPFKDYVGLGVIAGPTDSGKDAAFQDSVTAGNPKASL